jgi:hypothetical protein
MLHGFQETMNMLSNKIYMHSLFQDLHKLSNTYNIYMYEQQIIAHQCR